MHEHLCQISLKMRQCTFPVITTGVTNEATNQQTGVITIPPGGGEKKALRNPIIKHHEVIHQVSRLLDLTSTGALKSRDAQ